MQTRECHAEPTLLIQTQRRYPPKYRRVYHLQEELSRTQAVRAPFSLGQARFPCESFGWDYFLIFQRDFLDIDLYSYAIWWEFSMKKKKKSRTDRTSHPCQAPSHLGSSKETDGSEMPRNNWGPSGHISGSRGEEMF